MGYSETKGFGICSRLCAFLVLFIIIMRKVECDVFGNEPTCGSLFSENNFEGDAFILKDGDRSGNTKKDYRFSTAGWTNTESVRVQQNCTMTICNDTYFHGYCRSLGSSQNVHQERLLLWWPVASVYCTCAKDFKFKDVIIQKNSRAAGRAYLKKRSSSDEEKYIVLQHSSRRFIDFPRYYILSVRATVIRNDCNLTIVSGGNWWSGSRTLITTRVFEEFKDYFHFGWYKFECDENAFVRPPRPVSYPPLINLPATETELISQLTSNDSLILTHPGLKAALKSAAHRRSSKNAYILLIGAGNPWYVANPKCNAAKSNQIGECHVSVSLDELGVKNAQYRLITAPISEDDNEDARWVATLEDYLSAHEELNEAIPNVVVIYHDEMKDGTIAEKGSKFQRKLAVINALRGRLLDENFSNVVFLLHNMWYGSTSLPVNSAARLEEFKRAIESTCSFPKPLSLVIRPNLNYFDPKIDGHWKMPNGEFWPRNFQEKLVLLSEKGGDPLGAAIFQGIFPGEERELITMLAGKSRDLLPGNDSKVLQIEQLLANLTALQSLSDPFKENLERRKGIIADGFTAYYKPANLSNQT